mgnify:CR=1 FL=1
MKLSIVIPVYNSEKILDKLLKTIKNAISNAWKHKTDPHRMQQRTKTLLKKSFHTKDITNWELVLKLYSCPTKSMRKLIMKK